MSRLDPQKLHVTFEKGVLRKKLAFPRCYTLTHSDRTGDLWLTVGKQFQRKQISGLYTRLMRDEVLAEWLKDPSGPALHIYCQVSAGLGSCRLRDSIFRRELPFVLEIIRYGDRELFDSSGELDEAPVRIHFISKKPQYACVEQWGTPKDYQQATA